MARILYSTSEWDIEWECSIVYRKLKKTSILHEALENIEFAVDTSQKLELISQLLQRTDIHWNKKDFRRVVKVVSWISRQILSSDCKLTLEKIYDNINKNPLFASFSREELSQLIADTRWKISSQIPSPSSELSKNWWFWYRR